MAKILQKSLIEYKVHMQERNHPSCTTEKEFKAWKVLESELHTQPIREFFCRDCSVEYQSKMIKEGKCALSVSVANILD